MPARRTASAGAPTPAALAHAAARLTDRDHEILAALTVVRVLTNPMAARLWFGSAITARHRMQALAAAGVVTGFRPLRPGGGSHPVHYQLTPLGAHIAATAAGNDPELARAAAKNALERIAAGRAYLAHTTGVAWVWVGLKAAENDGRGALRWWDNRAAGELYQARGLVPDAAGIWSTPGGRRAAFVLEWDTGSERHTVIASKIDRYWHGHNGQRGAMGSFDAVADALGTACPLLLLATSTAGRERTLRATFQRRLAQLAAANRAELAERDGAAPAWSSWTPSDQSGWTLPAATAVLGPDADPAGPVWRPLGAGVDAALALGELSALRFTPPAATVRPAVDGGPYAEQLAQIEALRRAQAAEDSR
jgi:hypothetical protein